MIGQIVIVVLFFSYMTSAYSQAYVGKWDESRNHCTRTESDSWVNLSGNTFVAHESHCKLLKKVKKSENSWSASGVCEGEGERWPVRLEFSVRDRMLIISENGSRPRKLVLCPR